MRSLASIQNMIAINFINNILIIEIINYTLENNKLCLYMYQIIARIVFDDRRIRGGGGKHNCPLHFILKYRMLKATV